MELVAALADVGDIGKDLALLLELEVFALGRRLPSQPLHTII